MYCVVRCELLVQEAIVIFSNFHCGGRVDGEICLEVMVARVGLDFLLFRILSVIALSSSDYSQS